MRSLEDWELIALAKQGNIEAYDILVQRYKDKLLTYCYYLVKDITTAEDVVQDTFIRVYRSLQTLKPSAQFKTLLFGIARNLALNHIRNENRRKLFLTRWLEYFSNNKVHDHANTTSEKAIQKEIADVVETTILELPSQYREILILRENLGLDYEQISEVLSCNLGTVKSRLARARELLRNKLVDKGVIEK